MADRYWVGGNTISLTWSNSLLPWRASPGSSFNGTQGGPPTNNTLRIDFVDLAGPIANGHTLYIVSISGPAGTVAGLTFTDAEQTEGYFFVTTSRSLQTRRAMYTAPGSTAGVSVPVAGDTAYFTAGSGYRTGGTISLDTNRTVGALDLDGFRGVLRLGTGGFGFFNQLTVNGNIRWPNTGLTVLLDAFIKLVPPSTGIAGSTIDNNGITTVDTNLETVIYSVDGFTPPDNIIAGSVTFIGTVNLSNKTIISKNINAVNATLINPGTSTLICNSYSVDTFDTIAVKNLHNVEALYTVVDNYAFYTQETAGFVYNSLGIVQPEEIYSTMTTESCTVNTLNFKSSVTPQYGNTSLYGNTPGSTTITKSTAQNTNPVFLQIGDVYGIIFQPPNTFFTVGADFSRFSAHSNTNLRPSPNPLNFL
jgi:hypothetical protein